MPLNKEASELNMQFFMEVHMQVKQMINTQDISNQTTRVINFAVARVVITEFFC